MSQEKIVYALSDGKPKIVKELTMKLKLNSDNVAGALLCMWHNFSVLRSVKPIICYDKTFRGQLDGL